ncbi:hypothetical protein BH24ACT20_BH24ACT20_09560 [soil metagenome]
MVSVRVLLVEDNPGDARLVEILLEEVGGIRFDLLQAPTLEKALDTLDENGFDVVLLDLSLPDSSGLETVERVRERASDVPIVVLSGQDDEETALRSLESGAEDYLVKGQGEGEIMARSIRYAIQRKRAERRLVYLEQYDGLTGLANRTLFQDRLEQASARADRDETMLAVLSLGLNRFKRVNANYGHRFGDAVLREVARRLRSCVHEGNTVARVGGDEFCIVVDDVYETYEAISLVREILGAFENPFTLDGEEASVDVSIGIAVRPPSRGTRLVTDAEFAMSRAKDQGRNAYQFYTEEMNAQAFERLTLESNLRRALERDEYVVYYQPKVDLRTGSIFGAEALLRWRHPDMGLVSPAKFVPVLEETGFIVEVGDWVLRTACDQARRWTDSSFGPLQVAVNLSARQFREESLTDSINSCVREAGLDPQCLELEITESLIMEDPEASRAMLERLKSEKGIRTSVDDFGTGYSSLSYLKLFPLDALNGRPQDRQVFRAGPHRRSR